MVEVAFFADMLTLKEAIEFDEHVKAFVAHPTEDKA